MRYVRAVLLALVVLAGAVLVSFEVWLIVGAYLGRY
jgi:hypothetical protein